MSICRASTPAAEFEIITEWELDGGHLASDVLWRAAENERQTASRRTEFIMVWAFIFTFALSLVVLVWAMISRWRSATAEAFLLAPEEWIRATDELWFYSNVHRASIFGDVWYKAYFNFDKAKFSVLPNRVFVNEAALILIRPIHEKWKPGEPLVWLSSCVYMDFHEFDRIRGDHLARRDYIFDHIIEARLNDRPNEPELTHLSAELFAAGFDVAGALRQRQPLSVPQLAFSWSISSKESGEHEIGILFRLESADQSRAESLGILRHRIKAVIFGHLTKRQLNITIVISAIVAVLSLIKFVLSLGIWRHG